MIMGEKRAYKPRKPGGGRKKLKPEYDGGKNLKEQMDAAVALYGEECSLQSIADALNLNPIKVRKLLITAGVYESEVAEKVQATFEEYRETQDYKTSILSTANTLKLSKASVTSYLPYQKGVYFPSTEKEKISVGAERQRRYRAMKRWRANPTEENFWGVVVSYAGVGFKTYSGLQTRRHPPPAARPQTAHRGHQMPWQAPRASPPARGQAARRPLPHCSPRQTAARADRA